MLSWVLPDRSYTGPRRSPTALFSRIPETTLERQNGDGLFYDLDIDAARAGAHGLFRIFDEHLWFAEREGQNFIATRDHPTIADVACFPYIMLSEEGAIARQDYPAVRRCGDWFKRTPGFHRDVGDLSDVWGTAADLSTAPFARSMVYQMAPR
jgi:glutathione S-transferase